MNILNYLGWIWLRDSAGFVWSVDLGKFIYAPEAFVTDNKGWVNISN